MVPKKHIVIAEDDMDDAFLFKYAFEEICGDLELKVATDRIELMKILAETAVPAAIFIDLNTPQTNGRECLKDIKARGEFYDVPVVIISTSSDKDEIDDCLQNGAEEFYEKPSSFEGFKDILSIICNKKNRM